jgi:signal transduction histidine kinase
MRIRTQFIITLILCGAVLISLSASAVILGNRVLAVSEQEKIAYSVAQGSVELSYLANDFVVYGEAQQQARWNARFDSFSSDVARLRSEDPQGQNLVRSIESNLVRMREVFDSIVTGTRGAMAGPGGAIDLTFLQTSWSRMAVQSQGLSSDARRLAELFRDDMDRTVRARTILTYVIVGVLVLFLLAAYFLVFRRVLGSISRLRAGTEVIGAGNLEFKIAETGSDELGDLSRAFNRMTSDLKTVTASKADLEMEVVERKRVETALRESEQRLSRLFSSMVEGVCEHEIVYDESGRAIDYVITGTNPAYESITGLDIHKVLRIRATDLYGLNPPPYLEIYEKVASTGEPCRFETYYPPMKKHFSISTFCPGPGKFVTVFSDVSERKAVQDRMEHLASFPELNPNPIVEIDAAGNVSYANPAVREVFPDLLDLGIGHPFLKEAYKAIQDQAGFPRGWDVHVRDLWFEQVVTYVPGSRSYRLYAREITLRKKAESALRESEEKYRNLFDNMVEEVQIWEYVRDSEGRIKTWRLVDANPPTLRTWGRESVEEVMGRTVDEILGTGTTEHYMPVIQKVITEGVPYMYEDYSANLGKYFRFTTVPLGESFITTGADITRIKEAEEALKRYNAELEAANRELEAFSYSVSHDLRAPLRSMEGFSSALVEDYGDKLDEQGKRYLGYVQDASVLMGQLIDDLLKLSRVTRAEMNYETVDLSDLARKVALDLEKTHPERAVQLRIPANIAAKGDRGLLRLVLENLLGNAWKFSSKAGAPKIEFGEAEYNGKQAFFVKDNGVGFDMTYADRLFKPFQRLHKVTDFPGTGIGLATVQRIIHRHGGEVWAESVVGQGATFYFTLR